MSAVNSAKLKTNCDAVNSGQFIINQAINCNSTSTSSRVIHKHANHGTKLNQKPGSADSKLQIPSTKQETTPLQAIEIKTETSSAVSDFQLHSQKFTDIQKVLKHEQLNDFQQVIKQEQELQKQLYSGSNVASGWLRVNHNNKVIYIR